MKDEEKVEKKDTIQNETENKKEQKEEKKDCIIDPKQHELDELNDRYKRVLAEFENYKKRSSKEITSNLHRTNKKKSRKEISYD